MLLPILLAALGAIAPVTAAPHRRAICTPDAHADPAVDDAPAINTALKDCGDKGTILLPANRTYTLASSIDLSPCRACDFQINSVLQLTADWGAWFLQPAVFNIKNVTAAVIRSDSGTGLIDAQYYGLSEGSLVPFSNIRLFSITDQSSQIHVSGLRIKNVPSTAFAISGGSTALRFSDITFENQVRRGYEVQDASHVYVWNNTIRAGEMCVRVAPNSTNVQVEDSACIVNGTLNGGGRNSGIELSFGSSADNVVQWVRNVFVKRVRFVGTMDAVSLKSGSNNAVSVEVFNATFTDIDLEGPVRRPVYLGAGDLGDQGCGQDKCTKWNVTNVTLRDFEGSATERTALVCESTGDVCQFTVEGWNIAYT
jgi:hypothetical protein